MKNVLDTLRERGFIEQTTGDDAVRDLLETPTACYIGFDPTAASLHVGSLVPIMSLAQMQRHGHKPIALVGGATALVGDPSGKTEMRQMLTLEQVKENARGIKNQLAKFIAFEDDKARLVNNADWLLELEYIPFLRDVGRHFSVNRMLASESCKLRLETGLSFIEFNYALLQAYDFYHLHRQEECFLQMGGSDQWGNIVAGIDLVRRMEKGTVHGITFPLITTSSGAKMGKTAKGAVWLDTERTSPYEYYQYWVNSDDRDIARFMALFTFLPIDEIRAVETLEGAELNSAKVILAFEATRLAHGDEQALEAFQESIRVFGARVISKNIVPSSRFHEARSTVESAKAPVSDGTRVGDSTNADSGAMPSSTVDAESLNAGIPAFILFHTVGLAGSRGAARRLIEQGGAYVNDERVQAFDEVVTSNYLKNNEILLRAGKKRYHRVVVQEEK